MAYSLSDWKSALVILRGQFYEASQRYTGPRVCWFRLRYSEQVPFEDQRHQAEQLLSLTTKCADYGSIVVDENGKRRRYWCALFDGPREQYDLFKRLAVDTFTQAHQGLLYKIGNTPTILAGWPENGYAFQPETRYMYWATAAAFIRHAKPHPLLGLGSIYGGSLAARHAAEKKLLQALCEPTQTREDPIETAEAETVWNPAEAFCDIPIQAVVAPAPFDGVDRREITWNGPDVIGWETRHDVWRFSIAALDKLIEAAPILDPRGLFAYQEAIKGTAWKTIKEQINQRPEWEQLETDNGAKDLAKRYAEKNNLPEPPSRHPGRRSKNTKQNTK